jgi:hypothetical protein
MMEIQTINKKYAVTDDLAEMVQVLCQDEDGFDPELLLDRCCQGAFLVLPDKDVEQ